MNEEVVKFKIVIIGNQMVGKTSLIKQQTTQQFSENHNATVGIDFLLKTISRNNSTVKLFIWDTAGTERFRAILESYIKDSDQVVCVQDVGNRKSFDDLVTWVSWLKTHKGDDDAFCFVGNKVDLPQSQHAVSEQDIKDFAAIHKRSYFLLSAKESMNVNECFSQVVDELLRKHETIVKKSGIHVPFKDKKGRCC